MTQSAANCSPPSDSLITSENTGNFSDFGHASLDVRPKGLGGFFSEFPTQPNRKIRKREQGINFNRTGNLLRTTGITALRRKAGTMRSGRRLRSWVTTLSAIAGYGIDLARI